MVGHSGGNGDDPKRVTTKNPSLPGIDESIFEEETRILPMRSGGGGKPQGGDPLPGKIIGQVDAGKPKQDDLTNILPASSGTFSGNILATSGDDSGDLVNQSGDDDEEAKTVFMPAANARVSESAFNPAVGWLVLLEGPGRGNHCPVYYGQNSVGRGEDQRIRLNFGDARITRDTHAFIVYDDVARKFYLRDNGKANLIRLNKSPVMAPMELKDRDLIQIGETTMLFVALCGADFDWLGDDDGPNTKTDG